MPSSRRWAWPCWCRGQQSRFPLVIPSGQRGGPLGRALVQVAALRGVGRHRRDRSLVEVVSLLQQSDHGTGGGAGNGSQEVSHWPVEVRVLAIYPVLGHVLVFRRYTGISSSVRCILMWNYSRSCNLGSSMIETLQAVSYFLVCPSAIL